MQQVISTNTSNESIDLGQKIGAKLRGGEVIELESDLGGGKTTFTRGLVEGFGSADLVASPSFTINNVYARPDGKQLWHFDFYRLSEPGIIASELAEAQADSNNVIVVEWGEIVHDIMAENRIHITIKAVGETSRQIVCDFPPGLEYLAEGLSK